MKHLRIELTEGPILPHNGQAPSGCGASVEFLGVVRGEEDGQPIAALVYEAYRPMAEFQMERLVSELLIDFPCEAVQVTHRIGVVPVGETAIAVSVAARHRQEAFSFLAAFMDRLKQEVPIWKTRTIAAPIL